MVIHITLEKQSLISASVSMKDGKDEGCSILRAAVLLHPGPGGVGIGGGDDVDDFERN